MTRELHLLAEQAANDALLAEHHAEQNADWHALRNAPEPPELTAWAEDVAADRAAARAHAQAPCADCGEPRSAQVHFFGASTNRVACRFKEPNT